MRNWNLKVNKINSVTKNTEIDCPEKFLNSQFSDQIASIYNASEAKSIILTTVKHYSGLSLAEILSGHKIDASAEKKIIEALNKVLLKIPLQYILGETEFYGRKFYVDKNVLIPRCETEELVDLVVGENRSGATNIMDIGTGSGCIAISLNCELPEAKVYAIDISAEALKVAMKNCDRNKACVMFAEYDILGCSEFPYNTKFDIIVSNPPYVRMSEKKNMHENVLEHEPHTALFVPDSCPLIYYEACLRFAEKHLAGNGRIYVEINENLGKETVALFRNYGYEAISIKDLSGKNRIIKAIRSFN
ncbi:MAG: peptide chain release factor N(5)-glutamine methyltransferase [Prevotellaceae bacterium]|jgi:release factor glutamine methyltransferase|nr:peptide chain release factor N(5)-glutamine methyltransferase [Prevotellaceae bacterium]